MPEETQFTLDDLAAVAAGEQKTATQDLSTLKLEGDDVPEHLRGKTAKEILEHAKRTEEALRLSESARVTPTAPVAPQPTPTPTPTPQPQPELTKEKLKEIYDRDPLEAMLALSGYTQQTMDRHVTNRLSPLASASQSVAEQNAKAKYSEEFELFGDDIKKIMASVPDKSVLGSPEFWDDAIKYVRGANFDTLMEHRSKKQRAKAQSDEAAAAAGHVGNVGRSPSGGGPVKLDALQEEIARTMGMSNEDYIKWSQIGK